MYFPPAIRSQLARIVVLFPALRHRNYQLFFFGQGVSLLGTWMQQIALSWLVYRLTGSGFLLGVVGFSSLILTFLVAPFAGVIADRTDRRRLTIITQSTALAQSVVLASLALTGTIEVWHIIFLSMVLGLIYAVDIPVRQAFVVEMVKGRRDLPNAIALNSFLVNGTKLLGPAVAGIMIALIGEGACFLLNAISYSAVIVALFCMRLPPYKPRAAAKVPVLHNLKEGAVYAFHFRPIRALLLLLALVNLIGTPSMVLLPMFAKDLLAGGPATLGFLMAASGAGAMVATLCLAVRKTVRGLDRALIFSAVFLGIAMIVFAVSRNLALSLVLQLLIGFATMTLLASCNTLIQTFVDDDKRGRIMGFYTMCFTGMTPFGSLLAGSLVLHLGPSWTVTLGGLGCIFAAVVFFIELSRFGGSLHPAEDRPVTHVPIGETQQA